MVDSGYVVPTGNLVVKGWPTNIVFRNLEVADNAYPGRLVARGSTDYDVKVADGILPPQGFLGYEQQATQYQVSNPTTINVAGTEVPVVSGGAFSIYMPNGLAAGTVANQEDALVSWVQGQVIPGKVLGGKVAVKIPFGKSTTEKDTGIDLPAGVNVTGAAIEVTTPVAASTIDVGILSSESGGDADGFLDGVSCAAPGVIYPIISNTTAASITLGNLLADVSKSADTTANYVAAPVNYLTDGTAKSVTYTTTDNDIAGNIFLFLDSPGIKVVGASGNTVDASLASTGVFVKDVCI